VGHHRAIVADRAVPRAPKNTTTRPTLTNNPKPRTPRTPTHPGAQGCINVRLRRVGATSHPLSAPEVF